MPEMWAYVHLAVQSAASFEVRLRTIAAIQLSVLRLQD